MKVRAGRVAKVAAAAAVAGLLAPTVALASESGASWTTLEGILSNLSIFVRILGSVLMLWGAVSVGLSLKDGQGMSMDTNVAKLVGGAIIMAASFGFSSINVQ